MNKKDQEKYKKAIKEIQILVRHLECRKRFKSDCDLVVQGFQVMKNHMDRLSKDEEVKVGRNEMACVKTAVNTIFKRVVHESIDDYLRDLAILYMRLVFNWNNALSKDAELATLIRATSSIADGQMTMLDTINLLKRLIKQGSEMLNWRPPAFELARHYLESLNDAASTVRKEEDSADLKKTKQKKSKSKTKQKKSKRK